MTSNQTCCNLLLSQKLGDEMEALFVLLAALANFLAGGIWYGIFNKQWMHAWKLDQSKVNRADPIPYLIALIGSIWSAYGLFILIKHVRPQSFDETLFVALGTWLFIHVGMGAKHYSFARVKGKAFAIDYGIDLIGFVLMTFIIKSAI
jgi:hypothetical protein